MALLQISEPGMATAPHEHRLAVGIDLGTTNSLVASVRSGLAETLPDDQGRHLLPSVVRYLAGAGPQVGWEAKAAAVRDPLNTLASIKRLMGRRAEDLKTLSGYLPYEFAAQQGTVPRLHTAGGDVTAIEVSAEILKVLRERAEVTLGGTLTGAVVTVPAYFDDAQRQATKDAARLAGLNLFRLLNEPTAAAVAYGLDQGSEGVIAVYDLGGGTFDISILRLSKGVFEVLATGGDTALGGDDFDRAVAAWMLEQSGLQGSSDHGFLRGLMEQACAAKESLSGREAAALSLKSPDGRSWTGELGRAQLAAIIDPYIDRTLTACRRALRDAGVQPDEILEVVMVGGSTRSLRVRERVGAFFGREPLTSVDPDRVVAIGAALQADVLAGNKPDQDMLLLDVIPLSLGVETMGGLVEKIIPRNTPIPVARAQEFTTFKDGQSSMAIHVLQGERDLVSDCRSLARFTLKGIPPMVAGAARIRVTYQVDADGLLSVAAEESTQQVRAGVDVKPSYGLSDSDIERMLKESMAYASDDMRMRALREVQVEADRVIEALDAAVASDGDELLSADERARLDAGRAALVEARDEDDAGAIRKAMEALEKASEFYVERRMNASIRKAMAGHRLDEFR